MKRALSKQNTILFNAQNHGADFGIRIIPAVIIPIWGTESDDSR